MIKEDPLILRPTGPAEILQELQDELDKDPEPAPEDPEQATPCDCGECAYCLFAEALEEDYEACEECGCLAAYCSCDPDPDDFDPFEELGGEG